MDSLECRYLLRFQRNHRQQLLLWMTGWYQPWDQNTHQLGSSPHYVRCENELGAVLLISLARVGLGCYHAHGASAP